MCLRTGLGCRGRDGDIKFKESGWARTWITLNVQQRSYQEILIA